MISWRDVFRDRRRSDPVEDEYGRRPLPGVGAPQPRPVSDGMDELLAKSHDALGTFDMEGTDVPIILFEESTLSDIIGLYGKQASEGHGLSIQTDLNILQDYVGHVFVDVMLTFEDGKVRSILINANQHLKFFKDLASSGILALGQDGSSAVFMIQIPQIQKTQDALRIIERGLSMNEQSE